LHFNLSSNNLRHDGISKISDLISKTAGLTSLELILSHNNMGVKTVDKLVNIMFNLRDLKD